MARYPVNCWRTPANCRLNMTARRFLAGRPQLDRSVGRIWLRGQQEGAR